jgi:hypothetical protein
VGELLILQRARYSLPEADLLCGTVYYSRFVLSKLVTPDGEGETGQVVVPVEVIDNAKE